MKGDAKIIAILNEVLKAELTAINQYFLHAEMCENWGYERMAKHTRKESIEEMQHAEKLMERILLLDGAPNMTDYFKINIGQTVKQQLQNDLELEYGAVKRLNEGIKASVAAGDNGHPGLDPLRGSSPQGGREQRSPPARGESRARCRCSRCSGRDCRTVRGGCGVVGVGQRAARCRARSSASPACSSRIAARAGR